MRCGAIAHLSAVPFFAFHGLNHEDVENAIIGTVVGSLPGMGATIVSSLAYGDASRSTKHPEKIGHGSEEGLMAAEIVNNAGTGGSMTILLALGDPMILISRTISLVLLLAAVVSILWPLFKKVKILEGSENA